MNLNYNSKPAANIPQIEVDSSHPLVEMLTYKRPDRENSYTEFEERYILPIPNIECDEEGNWYVAIGDNPKGIFSCHLDTVHKHGGRQRVSFDAIKMHAFLADKTESDCLGADDAAGIYIMLEMIKREIPGLYVFHAAEEIGGIGSQFFVKGLAKNEYKFCVAFDRAYYTDVITHQAGMRCCSEEFAEAISELVGGEYAPDPTGSFTDSANYTEVVPECTNLSVGYFSQHTAGEHVDVGYVEWLKERACSIDWNELPIVREAGEDDFDDSWVNYRDYGTPRNYDYTYKTYLDYESLEELVTDYPGFAAALLFKKGVTEEEIQMLVDSAL